jgi:hypothetical protein
MPEPTISAPQSALQPTCPKQRSLTWQRLVLIVALLNVPAFFQGCVPQQQAKFRAKLTFGVAIPFMEIISPQKEVFGPLELRQWSSWRCLVNFALLGGGIWLLCRRFPWCGRIAASRWTIVTLAIVALVFNTWWYLPGVWFQLVFMPTYHVSIFLQDPVRWQESPNESVRYYVLLFSARLYYAACLAGVGGMIWGLRLFLRRCFFVPSGHWWQVQLGGLLVVVLVVGTAIGMVVRLLMH